MTLTQYAKGCKELGGLVESCVKLGKRCIRGCIGNQVLDIFDFTHVVCQAVCLVNKRPIAFKNALRDGSPVELPAPITPESLLKGHDLVTLQILPSQSFEVDSDWDPNMDMDYGCPN